MNRPVLFILAAVLAASHPAHPAQAATASALVGARIVDDKGKAVGKIEKVISGPDGQPIQVLVRVDRILRTLPVDALVSSGAGYASVLSRAEIAALPPSD
jgi:hypothetical protein